MKGIQLRGKCELRLMIIRSYFLNFVQLKFCIFFICMCMYIDTQVMHTHEIQGTTCESVLFSPGSQRLDSWGLRTSTLTPEPSEPPPWLLTLKSYVTGEPFTTQHGHTTLHSHWLHFRDGCTAFFRPRQRALFQKLCSEMQERHWALQRSIHGSWTECA